MRLQDALPRVDRAHQAFFRSILSGWRPDIEGVSAEQAERALAAFLRVRRRIYEQASAVSLPALLVRLGELTELADALTVPEEFDRPPTEARRSPSRGGPSERRVSKPTSG